MFPCGAGGGNLAVFIINFHINYFNPMLTPLFYIKAHLCVLNENEEEYFLARKHMDGLPDCPPLRSGAAWILPLRC